MPHIAAPITTLTGALWVQVGDYALSLYPFIDGRAAGEVGLSDDHWRALGAAFKQVHTKQLPPDLQQLVPREPFVPNGRHLISDLESVIAGAGHASSDPIQQDLAAFWHARHHDIHRVVERTDTLGDHLRRTSPPPSLALCHADLHTWNIMLDTAGQMWVVDWDETILALKERDLMYVVGGLRSGLVSPRQTACFLEGYGAAAIDPLALTYYRYGVAVQDMAANGERVLFLPDLAPEIRRAAVDGFMDLFRPGRIVEMAFASDDGA